jgi:Transcriptional regulatory protein, C terminal
VLKWTKRLLVGRPLRSERLGETLLPKKLALPVFCSDPLSSNAYATEETETNYRRVHLANLRRKLEPDPARPRYLITEPGIGYRFTP